jgi:hypothetical protein
MQELPVRLVAAYASLFVHQWDYYAIQQRDGSYRRIVEPLSLPLLASHLAGHCTLGTYLLDEENTCAFAVFDADTQDGFIKLVALAGELAQSCIPTVLEASRRGGHLWVHLVELAPATLVRAWLLPYALALGVELYPKQNTLAPGGSGSLIRLPSGVHRQSRGWYPFVQLGMHGELVPVGETVVACCAWVCEHIQRVAIPDGVMLTGSEMVSMCGGGASLGVSSLMASHGSAGSIRDWCQCQDIVAVIGRYVALDRRGVGSCPFKEHHYRGDVRPSFQVFGGENQHWYCHTWQRAGDLLDFLCLYHHLTPQEAWQRLRQRKLV